MAGRNLEDAVVQRANLMTSQFDRLRDRLRIPARRNASREQRLHFRGEVERLVVERVEEWLDTKAIPRGEERAVIVVPDQKREFATQAMQALGTDVFVKM